MPVQANGLPEGVQILPVTDNAAVPVLTGDGQADPAPAPLTTPIRTAVKIAATAPSTKATAKTATKASVANTDAAKAHLVAPRRRLTDTPAEATTAAPKPAAKPAKRKPGRPKAGRLDVPRPLATPTATGPTPPPVTAAPLPSAPKLAIKPSPVVSPPASSSPARRMSDLAPRHVTRHGIHQPSRHRSDGPHRKPAPAPAKTPRPAVHRLGVPPLHYGAVLAFSLRSRLRPRLFALAATAALILAVAAGYGTWLLLHGGLTGLAAGLMHGGPALIAEAVVLAVLYYIGRSVGQTAIVYGIARETDQRPVGLSHQLGVGFNTFGRRLILDLGSGLLELALIALMVTLVLTGGGAWPVNPWVQILTIFAAFLVLLYVATGVAIARSLAGVALALTNQSPLQAARSGWQLFAHRFELLGLRLLVLVIELVLAAPLALLAAAFIAATPAHLWFVVVAGVGLLAWIAGALFGAGTASWWGSMYRQLVQADRHSAATTLLSSRQPQEPGLGPLVLVVALSSFLLAVALTVPGMSW